MSHDESAIELIRSNNDHSHILALITKSHDTFSSQETKGKLVLLVILGVHRREAQFPLGKLSLNNNSSLNNEGLKWYLFLINLISLEWSCVFLYIIRGFGCHYSASLMVIYLVNILVYCGLKHFLAKRRSCDNEVECWLVFLSCEWNSSGICWVKALIPMLQIIAFGKMPELCWAFSST